MWPDSGPNVGSRTGELTPETLDGSLDRTLKLEAARVRDDGRLLLVAQNAELLPARPIVIGGRSSVACCTITAKTSVRGRARGRASNSRSVHSCG
jgi:hypothetical protein